MPREIYAWVADDPDGDEGILALPVLQGLAAVHSRPAFLRSLRKHVQLAANARNSKARLVKYVEADVLEEINPA